jgi:hypothetical protein
MAKYSHLGALHQNHRFMGRTPRTAREVYGRSLEIDGHREADAWVFGVCAVGLVVLLALGVF